ncbi:hypothetical protein NM688_g5574 [Phlebia brevispora]|uniref:Uncharacterized protein n=1 Tax=Phlebia brevispora TaxID=194682 RepID=A0ACC1STI0_9APHY|nr:hypothetical protein NM688_g5574 [Phlebia brevispora]
MATQSQQPRSVFVRSTLYSNRPRSEEPGSGDGWNNIYLNRRRFPLRDVLSPPPALNSRVMSNSSEDHAGEQVPSSTSCERSPAPEGRVSEAREPASAVHSASMVEPIQTSDDGEGEYSEVNDDERNCPRCRSHVSRAVSTEQDTPNEEYADTSRSSSRVPDLSSLLSKASSPPRKSVRTTRGSTVRATGPCPESAAEALSPSTGKEASGSQEATSAVQYTKVVRPFKGGIGRYTRWYSSVGGQTLAAPPVGCPGVPGDLYVHGVNGDADGECTQIWLCLEDKRWSTAEAGMAHPTIDQRVLWLRTNREPSWIKRKSYVTYQSKDRLKEAMDLE